MNIIDQIKDWDIYILLGLIGAIIILLILVILLLAKQHKLNKKYNSFMTGKDAKNLEGVVFSKFELLESISEDLNKVNNEILKMKDNLNIAYQKLGIVKYDAFKEVGGKMSFALALLTKENDGFVMNCMHSSREGCFTYVKEIVKGESYVILSEEESQVLEEAKNNRSLLK